MRGIGTERQVVVDTPSDLVSFLIGQILLMGGVVSVIPPPRMVKVLKLPTMAEYLTLANTMPN